MEEKIEKTTAEAPGQEQQAQDSQQALQSQAQATEEAQQQPQAPEAPVKKDTAGSSDDGCSTVLGILSLLSTLIVFPILLIRGEVNFRWFYVSSSTGGLLGFLNGLGLTVFLWILYLVAGVLLWMAGYSLYEKITKKK